VIVFFEGKINCFELDTDQIADAPVQMNKWNYFMYAEYYFKDFKIMQFLNDQFAKM
jgi:hypothetical protein